MTDTDTEFPIYPLVEQFYEEETHGNFDSAFATLDDLTYQLDLAKQNVVRQMRDQGYSWTDIGRSMHISRQAALQWATVRGLHTVSRRNPNWGGRRD